MKDNMVEQVFTKALRFFGPLGGAQRPWQRRNFPEEVLPQLKRNHVGRFQAAFQNWREIPGPALGHHRAGAQQQGEKREFRVHTFLCQQLVFLNATAPPQINARIPDGPDYPRIITPRSRSVRHAQEGDRVDGEDPGFTRKNARRKFRYSRPKRNRFALSRRPGLVLVKTCTNRLLVWPSLNRSERVAAGRSQPELFTFASTLY
jgi:hypothetical protein